MYNGIVNVYKEQGFTSFDVVAKMRGIFGQKKIGHTGTLDPMAEGVLLVCLGKAAKLSELLLTKEKEYDAVLRLGIRTDTDDVTGNVLDEAKVNVSEEAVRNCFETFKGVQQQIPPVYSAIKINGKKLYEYARAGETVVPDPRTVEIFELDITGIELPLVHFHIRCSKGTYIRSLCRDIGDKLGCFGTMDALVRTENCGFTSSEGFRLEELSKLKEEGRLEDAVMPIDALLRNVPSAKVSSEGEKLLVNGNKLSADMLLSNHDSNELENAEYIRIYHGDELMALYSYDKKAHCYRCFKYLG
jgi:tRNA pseudouridine synthase B (EC 4.2.1.70)